MRARLHTMSPGEVARQWSEVRRLVKEMFEHGGATIESPADQADGSLVDARTVIQPDGDVVHFVGDGCLRNEGIRTAHVEKVAAWYASSATAFGSIRSAWRAAVALVSGALGLLLSVVSSAVWGGYVWVAILVVVPMALSLGLRTLLPRLLRKAIGPGLL
jgi:hypothetical protein